MNRPYNKGERINRAQLSLFWEVAVQPTEGANQDEGCMICNSYKDTYTPRFLTNPPANKNPKSLTTERIAN